MLQLPHLWLYYRVWMRLLAALAIAVALLMAYSPAALAVDWHHDPEVSWYGPGFYGHRTACGLAYTKEILGVAHRSLPCGTLVTFRNPANGRTATVPVIDRGPYVAGRQWDLSGGLCVKLDHCYTGSMDWHFGGKPAVSTSGSGGGPTLTPPPTDIGESSVTEDQSTFIGVCYQAAADFLRAWLGWWSAFHAW